MSKKETLQEVQVFRCSKHYKEYASIKFLEKYPKASQRIAIFLKESHGVVP